MVRISNIALIGVTLFGVGCGTKKPVGAIVPLRCLHDMYVTEFADKCKEIPQHPNEAICNNVHIRFACVEYPTH